MNIYITDKTGKKFWNTSVSAAWSSGERRNLTKHLDAIKSNHPSYAKCNIDAETARIVEESDRFDLPPITDDQLLSELLS